MGILTDIGNWLSSVTGVGAKGQSGQSSQSFDPSSVPSPDEWLGRNDGYGYQAIDNLNNRIKDSYIASGGTGYNGPSDYSGQAKQWFESYEPPRTDYVSSDPVGNFIDNVRSMFFSAPQGGGSGSYWDESSPDYDPAKAFLGPEVMPYTQREERAADKAAYDQYMSYYNDRSANPDSYQDNQFDPDYMSKFLPWSTSGGEDLVDNGTNSYLNRTSNYITGAEAKKQASYFGNDALSQALSEVGDNEILSKNSLQRYGYRPFTDSSSVPNYLGSKLSQGMSALGEASEEGWNKISDMRNEGLDWSVKLFDTEFSGKAVDQAIHDARDQGAGAYDEDGNWMPSGVQIDPTMAVQRDDGLWVAPASNGSSYVIDAEKFDKGGYTLRYQDAVVVDKDGNEQRIPMEYWADVTKDYSVAEFLAAVKYPELSLEEREAKAAEMYDDMGGATDYGFLNVNAPSYKSDDVLSEYALPSMINGTLSSMAYFNPVTLAERSALSGGMSAGGVNAQSQNVGKNGIRSYTPAANQSLNTIMGVLAPVAESKLGSLGNVGGKGFLERGTEALTSRIPGVGETWAARELVPAAVSEGLEEVITDPLYTAQEAGTGAYANQAKDSDGLLAYDQFGRPTYEDTGAAERIRNYLEDQPNNFVMGAALGGGVNLAARGLQHTTKAGREQLAAEKADRDFFNQYVRQMGGAFTRGEVSDMRRQAGSSEGGKKVPLTMQEFEEMLENANAVEEMTDEDVLEAQVKRNVR